MAKRIEGKIPHALLRHLLSKVTRPGREVLIGPGLGEDAFAVGIGQTVIVASTDPVTFTADHIGYYAVNVNANDVATMGARPRWFMATALVPPGTRRNVLSRIFSELDTASVDLGIRLCGGHTEATSTVTRPIVVGAMIGTVSRRRLVRPERARDGDAVLLTKRLALEGTAILAREKQRSVQKILGIRRAAKARRFLFDPGISIVKEAMGAVETAPVHAMHDPTEGGFIWGVKELCLATGRGAEIDLETVPLYEETRLLCEHLGLNPMGLIASGSLLIVVSSRSAPRVVRAIAGLGIECTRIGTLRGRGLRLLRHGKPVRIPALKSDEISKVL